MERRKETWRCRAYDVSGDKLPTQSPSNQISRLRSKEPHQNERIPLEGKSMKSKLYGVLILVGAVSAACSKTPVVNSGGSGGGTTSTTGNTVASTGTSKTTTTTTGTSKTT